MKHFWSMVLLALGLVVADGRAMAEERVALVVGNAEYPDKRFRDPANHATVMARALGQLGFEVIEARDAERAPLETALKEFAWKLEEAGPEGVGLFFYSGLIDRRGERFRLLPVDGGPDRRGVGVQRVFDLLEESGTKLNFLIVNGLATSFEATPPVREPGRKTLVVANVVEPTDRGADDKRFFVSHLSSLLKKRGLPALEMLEMLSASLKTDLVPHRTTTTSLIDALKHFQFARPDREPAKTALLPGRYPDELTWEMVRNSPDPEAFSFYLDEFPEGRFAAQARHMISLGGTRGGGPGSRDAARTKVVRIFYGTDRVPAPRRKTLGYSGERAGSMTLGRVFVSVPVKAHRIGEIERPSWLDVLTLDFDFDEDPERDFVIQANEKLSKKRFIEEIQRASRHTKQALVFVHGYNVTFDAAAFRTAQLTHDLKFRGVPFFYSWPSRGEIEDYRYDLDSALQARDFLGNFLSLVKWKTGAERIHIIGHSMGNLPLMEVLRSLQDRNKTGAPLFNQIVLAAPDIDVTLFRQIEKRVRGVARGYTLYASANDRAMLASRTIAGGIPRVGDVPEDGPAVFSGIDTIDISAVGSDLLGLNHSTFAENRVLLQDIGLLLARGERPPDRRNPTLLDRIKDGLTYWVFPR